jgi:hypothetical protein
MAAPATTTTTFTSDVLHFENHSHFTSVDRGTSPTRVIDGRRDTKIAIR